LKLRSKWKVRLDIVVRDRNGKVVERRRIENDLVLRNFMVLVKRHIVVGTIIVADGCRDVNNNAVTAIGTSSSPYQMLGSGTTPETSGDYRIQTPLYTSPDPGTAGVVTPGAGNQVTVAATASHTFAAQTDVYEAGLLSAAGSATVYLTNNNLQYTRNTFAKVTVPAGGTFTGTYTFTEN